MDHQPSERQQNVVTPAHAGPQGQVGSGLYDQYPSESAKVTNSEIPNTVILKHVIIISFPFCQLIVRCMAAFHCFLFFQKGWTVL